MQNSRIFNGARFKFFFEVGVFKQSDVIKQMFQKRYKISFRMYSDLVMHNFQELMWKIEFIGKCS